MTTAEIKNKIIDPWHFMRTCTQCGYIWHGLHCIHDRFQNPCGKCGETPKPVDDEGCTCEFNCDCSY